MTPPFNQGEGFDSTLEDRVYRLSNRFRQNDAQAGGGMMQSLISPAIRQHLDQDQNDGRSWTLRLAGAIDSLPRWL